MKRRNDNHSPGPVIRVIKCINERSLKNNVLCHSICHSISSATLEAVADQIQLYDLQNFSTVILSVGGNNVANDCDLEYLEGKFDQLFVQI